MFLYMRSNFTMIVERYLKTPRTVTCAWLTLSISDENWLRIHNRLIGWCTINNFLIKNRFDQFQNYFLF